jgi:hypothetical protein
MASALELTPELARIFRITHVANVPWILENGLHCGSSAVRDPAFVQIGNPDLINKRRTRIVPVEPKGTLNDYVPFYFTPFSPMLYNIATGYSGVQRQRMKDIAILVSNLPLLSENGVQYVFTDQHAYMATTRFSGDPSNLPGYIDWKILQAQDFRRNDTSDLGKTNRYQAELLAFQHVPVQALAGIVCHGAAEETALTELVQNVGVHLSVTARPTWFF